MTLEEAHAILSEHCRIDVGRFYGKTEGLSLGAGLIYQAVRFPIFDVEEQLFLTTEGPVYVLTHECDVDPGNTRAFNTDVVVCPLIPLARFLEVYSKEFGAGDSLRNFLVEVAKRGVSRVVYIPPSTAALEHGGFLYFNALASSHVSAFQDNPASTALSQYGLREIDVAFQNHFLREKSQSLGLALSSRPWN
jgi:hypothetical protein